MRHESLTGTHGQEVPALFTHPRRIWCSGKAEQDVTCICCQFILTLIVLRIPQLTNNLLFVPPKFLTESPELTATGYSLSTSQLPCTVSLMPSTRQECVICLHGMSAAEQPCTLPIGCMKLSVIPPMEWMWTGQKESAPLCGVLLTDMYKDKINICNGNTDRSVKRCDTMILFNAVWFTTLRPAVLSALRLKIEPWS